MNRFIELKEHGKTILFSELLATPPPDDVLLELFPCSWGGHPYITQSGLEILKLRLDGLTAREVGEKLNLTLGQVNGRFQNIKLKLMEGSLPSYIEIDSPGIRRLLGMDVPITSGYTKVSELLRDMPSDQELLELSKAHEDKTRQMLKTQSRLYERTQSAEVALRNGLISLLDQTFPGVNQLFDNTPRANGHVKWVDLGAPA